MESGGCAVTTVVEFLGVDGSLRSLPFCWSVCNLSCYRLKGIDFTEIRGLAKEIFSLFEDLSVSAMRGLYLT